MKIKLLLFFAMTFFYFTLAEAAEKPVSFKVRTVHVGNKSLKAEIAETPEQLSQGLMHRKAMDENAGMLFVFPEERPLSFWMKNTFIPLSIGFFDKNKKLLEVLDMEPVTSVMQVTVPQYASKLPAKYALEVNRGWFKKHGLKSGAILKLD